MTTAQLPTKPKFSAIEQLRIQQFSRALAAAVAELHKAGAEWQGNGVVIISGTDQDGKPAIGMATDGTTQLSQEAAMKAIKAYADTLNPPDLTGTGQYL